MLITASVTLAALATAIWLPRAWLGVKRSPWAWMTLAMLAMLWRGEAWKTVCLREQAQLSQCLQQSPKIVFSVPETSLARAVSHHRENALCLAHLPPVRLLSSHGDSAPEWRPLCTCDSDRLLQTPQVPHPYIAESGNGSEGSSVHLITPAYKIHTNADPAPT